MFFIFIVLYIMFLDLLYLKPWPLSDGYIARGSFGTVSKGLYCGTPVAVKTIFRNNEEVVI